MPAHRRAILWRGAFGSVFRGLVCHDEQLACEACPLRSACPFPRVFAPSIPEGRPTIARLKDPPRPFVISDPEPESAALPARTPLGLGLVRSADMDTAADAVIGGVWVPREMCFAELPARFGYHLSPQQRVRVQE